LPNPINNVGAGKHQRLQNSPATQAGLSFSGTRQKLILSIPIATTPAAEPMIKALPPVPVQKAMNDQK
jgi:hypothetical protein